MARKSGGRMILGIAARLSLSVLLHRLSRIATPATPQRKPAERATIGPFHEKPPAPWAAPTQIRRRSESRERDGSSSLELRTIAAASRRSRSCTRQFRGHLKTFLAEIEEDGSGLPRFVVAEFERYLRCGILANGYARVRCVDCGDELL